MKKIPINKVLEMFAQGGQTEVQPAELEKEENVLKPNGETQQFDGASHEQGGIKTLLPVGTKVFSDSLKIGGRTFAELAKPLSTKKFVDIAQNRDSSKLARKTAEKMIDNRNKKLSQLFTIQETLKGKIEGDMFRKKFGGFIKKYDGGGELPGPSTTMNLKRHQLIDYFSKNLVQNGNVLLHPDNYSWALSGNDNNVNDAYNQYINGTHYDGVKNPNYITGEGLLPKTGKLPSQIGTPIKPNLDTPPSAWDVPEQYDVNGINAPRNLPYNKQAFGNLNYSPTTTMSTPSDAVKIRQAESGYNPALGKLAAQDLSGSQVPGPERKGMSDATKKNIGTGVTQGLKFLSNNLGNLAYLSENGRKYDTVVPRTIKPSYMQDNAAINDIKNTAAGSNYLLRNTFASNPGGLLAGLTGNTANNSRSIAGVREQYANQNAQIDNQTNQYNSQVRTNADIATAQNKGVSDTNRYAALNGIGQNINSQVAGANMQAMDEKLLPMFLKLNPWMSKYMDTTKLIG